MLFEELTGIIDPEPHDAAMNMAIDEALLHAASEPLLRCYHWIRPAVSFGYFGKYDSVAAAWPGRETVRRWTGGGVVPHGEDLTYTLIVPKKCAFSRHHARDSYRMIHECIAAHLASAGKSVAVAVEAQLPRAGKVAEASRLWSGESEAESTGHFATGPSQTKASAACFENPVAFDLLANNGSKIAGAAQRRTQSGLLHQGSIRSEGLSRSFFESMADTLSARVQRRALNAEEMKSARILAAQKYSTEAWLKKF